MRRRCLAGTATAVAILALTGCGGGQEAVAPSCPRVDAVAGLDRLDLAYPGAERPVRTALDIVDVGCEVEGDELLVGAAVAVRLLGARPPGVVEVPFTVVIDTPQGMTPSQASSALIPPGATGTIEYFEHRFPVAAAREEVLVRVLYALVPDERELDRLSRERPRP